MDDILGFVFEMIMEIIGNIIEGIAGDKSKPKWLRYLANGLIGLFLIGIAVCLVWAGVVLWSNSQTGGIIYFAVILLLALLLTFFHIRRRRKARKNKELEPLEQEWQ